MVNRRTAFSDLRAFVAFLEGKGELIRVHVEVDPYLEMTQICKRLLAQKGPAVLFHRVKGYAMPVLANLFGTEERVGLALGSTPEELETLGQLLADLKQLEPPRSVADLLSLGRRLARARHMPPRTIRRPPCRQVVFEGRDVDLGRLPVQTCWPDDVGPLVTWPLVITKGADGGIINMGIYRMQVLGRNRLIVRWLKHRGGAGHAREHRRRMPIAVAIGCDPGTILAAVTPVPETLSEYAFAGLLRASRVEVAPGMHPGLPVPARAEIILEGEVDLEDTAYEGPFGDHTGYYNEVEKFPVFTVQRLTMRRDPIYLSTFTGRPPDEPAILALALNRVFTPLLKKQFPEITAFHLSMEAASYRVAVVGLRKSFPGHAFRVMAGIWGFLRQFLYTKYIIVVDSEIPVDNPDQVMAAIMANVHAGRDLHLLHHTPIDYLDFASPVAGLGGKMGIDATAKHGVEIAVVQPRPAVREDSTWREALLAECPYILEVRLVAGGRMAIARVDGQTLGRGRLAIAAVRRLAPPGAGADQLWVLDADCDVHSWADFFWSLATRTDPGRDVEQDWELGRFAMDATMRTEIETGRRWGKVLAMDQKTVDLVRSRWSEYGLPGSADLAEDAE